MSGPADDPARWSASAQARALREGRLDPVALLEAHLDRVAAHNPALNAVVTLNEGARAEAEAARAALRRGEGGILCGIPVGIKDVTPVRGLRTTRGSPRFAHEVPDADGPAVVRLRQQGAVMLGKTNTPELACGAHTDNPVFGPTRNPRDLTRSPGGSTGGGAAAVAASLIALAEGTDMGGSLRIPAAFCGVVGLRPGPGRVPTGPLRDDDLQVSGPMARCVEDIALAMDALCGGGDHHRRAAEAPAAGLRVGWCADLSGRGVEEALVEVAEAAIARALRAPRRLHLDWSAHHDTFATLRAAWMVEQHLPLVPHLDALTAPVRENIQRGLALDMTALAAARRARRELWGEVESVFNEVDVLLTPTVACPPFPIAQGPPMRLRGRPMATPIDWVSPTYLLSLTRCPVLALPCGLDGAGMPVGVQAMAARGREDVLMAFGAAWERAIPPLEPPLP